MTHLRTKQPTNTQQHGLGLISAIFFITVVAMLSVAIARSVTTSAAAYSQDTMSFRAFLAAESGAQLGVHAIYPPLGVSTCTNLTIDFDSINLTDCEATVTCQVESVAGTNYHTVTSAGRCLDGGQISAERIIVVRTQP